MSGPPISSETAALIIGGGPAGAAAAITLARAGGAPLLLEREAGPRDVVCGGFLGWDALAALERLGLNAAALGARPIRWLRLVAGGRAVEARLPERAAGLSRRTLDAALLAHAEETGARVRRGARALALDPETRIVRVAGGETVRADTVVLATGKHELRGALREGSARPGDVAVGLRTALPADDMARLDGVIELHLFDGGYAGLLLQEDGAANFCLSVSGRRLARAGGVEALIGKLADANPALAARIGPQAGRDWSSVAHVPYGWRARETRTGLYRAGDQAAVIASLAGDGIAIALASGALAGAAIAAGVAAGDFQRRFAQRAGRPLAVAGQIRALAERRRGRGALMTLAAIPGAAALASRLTRIAD